MDKPIPSVAIQGVDFSYYDGPVLREINLTVEAGELVALVGPNGAGKTTLLKVISGLLPPRKGRVLLGGQDVRRLSRREIARRVAMVPQAIGDPFGFTAYEMVMLGRTPYVRPLAGPSPRDCQVVREQMRLTDTADLAERPFNELSGGEQQRVILAMALAQEPELLLLDEPVAHLDIGHQVEILELVKGLNRSRRLTVLATMHDLNLAALYFDRLILLDRGQVAAQGAPTQVLDEERIRRVFGTPARVQEHPIRRTPHVVLLPLSD